MSTHAPAAPAATPQEGPRPPGRPRLRRWAFRLLAIALSFALAFVLLEVGIRLFVPQPTHFYSFADFNLPDGTLRPGATGMLCGVPVAVNEYGERGRVYSRAKPPGTFRICVIGDSIVFGLGVLDDEKYPQMLQRRLRARFGNEKIEVVPFGQVHYHLSAYRERLLPKALSFDPDLVVLGFVLNDFELRPASASSRGATHPAESRRHGVAGYATRLKRLSAELRKYSHLVYLLRKQAQVLLSTKLISRDELIHYWELECMYPETEDFRLRWAYTVEQSDAMQAACRARGVPMAIAVTPFDLQLNAERLEHYRHDLEDLPGSCLDAIPQRMLRDHAAERGITFVDLTESFRTHAKQVFFEVLEGRTDLCHPNAEGHRLMGEILAERLAPMLAARSPTSPLRVP